LTVQASCQRQRLWPNDLQLLFGEVRPFAENLRILEGGENLTLGSRKLEVVYTPGHASHTSVTSTRGRRRLRRRHGGRAHRGNSFVMPPLLRGHRSGIWDTSSPPSWSANRRGFSHTLRLFEILRASCCSEGFTAGALTAEILRTAPAIRAIDSFMSARMRNLQYLPAGEADPTPSRQLESSPRPRGICANAPPRFLNCTLDFCYSTRTQRLRAFRGGTSSEPATVCCWRGQRSRRAESAREQINELLRALPSDLCRDCTALDRVQQVLVFHKFTKEARSRRSACAAVPGR